ncbi:MAG: PAS domain S-box protein [Burkholderiaceae bacterium]|nr:PAS domain S-box protein [Burkholderiaceae bacterium]
MDSARNQRPLGFVLSQGPSLKTRITAVTLAIFLASLWGLGTYASYMVRKDMERALGEQQYSTVKVVAAQINGALIERQQALEIAAKPIALALGKNQVTLQALLDARSLLPHLFNGGVLVLDIDGTAVAEAPARTDRIGANYGYLPAISKTLKEGSTTISPPMKGFRLHAPVFAITIPLRDPKGTLIGAIAGVTNLGLPGFLDDVTQSNYGKTGGYMFVERQSRQVVTATDKLLSMEKLPAEGINPLVDRFIGGYEGSGVMFNPMGVEVLASAKGIPAAGWYVAVALPVAEAFAPIHDAQHSMLLATLSLTLIAGVLTWWLIKRLLTPMQEAGAAMSAMAKQQVPLKAIALSGQDEIAMLIDSFNQLLGTLKSREEALRQSEHKFSEISENVDAYIYLKDNQGRHLFANRSMRELLGVSKDEIIGKSDEAFFDDSTVAQLRSNDLRVLLEGKSIKTDETNLRLRSGVSFTTLTIKIPLYNSDGQVYGLCGISTDITARKAVEEELRIASIAFECQEGIIVMNTNLNVLRVNRAFSEITGFAAEEAQEAMTKFMASSRNPASTKPDFWDDVQRLRTWKGEVQLQHKRGEYYTAVATITAVENAAGTVSHFVCNIVDNTSGQLLEQQLLANEAAQRNALIREVHHRIKNNLQGITGLLRQYAHKQPGMAEPINQAISQMQSVSVIHGMQGRAEPMSIRLCELTSEIAAEIQLLWRTPIQMDIPWDWEYHVVKENEAVPMALVLNELILNAVKHSDDKSREVRIAIRSGEGRDAVTIVIYNTGQLAQKRTPSHTGQSGLQLIAALLPREGAHIERSQEGDMVATKIEVGPPVIFRENKQT